MLLDMESAKNHAENPDLRIIGNQEMMTIQEVIEEDSWSQFEQVVEIQEE